MLFQESMKARCFLFVNNLWDCEIGRFLFFSYHCFFACLCVATVTWMLVDKKASFYNLHIVVCGNMY